MAKMDKTNKKIALLHRYPQDIIRETNAAFPYLLKMGFLKPLDYRPGAVNYLNKIDVLTFKKFNRVNGWKKFWKSIAWIFYAPCLVAGRGYDVIYCDDSYPFYPALVKMFSPRSRVVIRLGDLHLLYYYSGWVYKVLHFLEKIAWIMADEIIVISEVMADYIQEEIGKRPKVALDPVDPKDFPIGGSYNSGAVMFHGTLTKNKNVDVLLEAAELLPDVDFTIIGDGPDMARLQKKAPANVYFYGWAPFNSIYQHIARCSIGVALRSDNPGNEYVVTSPFLQYGIMGKPCLVTERKVFGTYQWQFSGSVELAQKIKKVMRYPLEGKKLREFILENHDAEKIGDAIWKILTSPS